MTRIFQAGSTRDHKMASLDRNAPPTVRLRLPALALVAPMFILTAVLGGCAGSPDGMTTSAIKDDYRQRHPIVLTEKEHNIDIPVSASDRHLTTGMRDTIRGFVQDYRAHASGTVEILSPRESVNAVAASALRQQIRRELVTNGIPSGRVVDSYYVAGGPGDAAPIRLRFTATTAATNACGQWPDDLADNAFDNQNYYNFGCATQHNLAAQVANPTDLVSPRAVTPIDADQRSKVINDYRTGSDPNQHVNTWQASVPEAEIESKGPAKQDETMNAIDYEIESTEADAEEAPRSGNLDNMRPLPRISVHAFCESEQLQRVMDQCANDRRMSKVSLRITSGSTAAAANMFASTPTPNLIILETRANPRNLLAELAPLAAVCDPSTKVVIVGYHNDISLYRELIRNGISEYIVQPMDMADLMTAMAGIFIDPDAEPLGRSIAFIGAKGGVGASTIAHNCAFGISSLFSTETILADLDLPYGTANIDFDQDPAQGIAEAVFSPERLDEVFLDRLLTKCSQHLSLLAAPSMLDRAYDFDGPAFLPVLDVLQRSAPVAVLDVPHVWTEWTRSVLAAVDEVVICAAPDLANLRNAKNLVDALRKLRPNDKAPHLVLNQVGMPKRPEINPSEFCAPLEIDPIAIIPFDINLFGNAANSGQMISETDPKSPVTEIFSQISHIVTGRVALKKTRKGGLLGLLKRK